MTDKRFLITFVCGAALFFGLLFYADSRMRRQAAQTREAACTVFCDRHGGFSHVARATGFAPRHNCICRDGTEVTAP